MSAESSAPRKAAFVFIFVTVLLDMLALGVMVPVLPKLVVELGGGDIARGARITGYFGFAYALMQLFFAPLLGMLSDRFGRRPVVLLSNFGLGIDYVVMALAPSIGILFVGRLISGITSATFPTASAYVADVTPPAERAKRFGMLGAAFGLGFVVGPAVGGALGSMSLRAPFWAAAGLTLANAAYGLFVLPESLPPERRARFQWKKANPFGALSLLRSHPELSSLAAAVFVNFLAHEALPSTFVLYADFRYGFSERDVGLALAAVGVTSTIVAGGLVGRSVRRFGERRTAVSGLLAAAVGLVWFGLAPSGALFLIGIPIEALWGFVGPSMQALLTHRVGQDAQGQLQGALGSLRGITGLIGPLLFTTALSQGISGDAVLPGAAFLLAAGLLVLSLFITLGATRRVRTV